MRSMLAFRPGRAPIEGFPHIAGNVVIGCPYASIRGSHDRPHGADARLKILLDSPIQP